MPVGGIYDRNLYNLCGSRHPIFLEQSESFDKVKVFELFLGGHVLAIDMVLLRQILGEENIGSLEVGFLNTYWFVWVV